LEKKRRKKKKKKESHDENLIEASGIEICLKTFYEDINHYA
jgi:hypothetical protein